jgi:ATP-dependent exoDNAse (exonuclease V) beta subunit
LTPLSLSVNFRSTADIVNWNNDQFSKIFPQKNDITNGAVKFNMSIAHSNQSDITNPINITGMINSDDYTHAKKVIADIKEHRTKHPSDRIAILVRSRPHLSTILPLLQSDNIPYRAVDINPLADRQTVIDLLSLTCAMLHLGDHISWLAILRAPWCGLTLDDLHAIINKHPKKIAWELISSDALLDSLPDTTSIRLRRVVNILKTQLANRDRYDIRTWIESTWQLLGGPAAIESAAELQDADEFFHLLESMDPVNIDVLNEKIANHFASSDHESDLLQIMTIHSAKGLEFDAVFIPQIHKKSPRDDKQLLLWMEQPTQDKVIPLLAPITATGSANDSTYDYIARLQTRRKMLEVDRLFYVATTRAKKYLYLYFNTGTKTDGSYTTATGSLLEKLLPLLPEQIKSQFIKNTSDDNIEVTYHYPPIRRLAGTWSNPYKSSDTSISLHKKISGMLLSDQTPRLIGILSHRFLQLISLNGITWWKSMLADKQHRYIKSRIAQAGISPADVDHAYQRINHIISNTLNDPKGMWILENHSEAKSEFAVSTAINNEIENLIIDRTFIDNNGDRWIIDYKTTVNSHDELTTFLDAETKKYQLKMERYSHAFYGIDNRRIRLGLYFPALPAWKEL